MDSRHHLLHGIRGKEWRNDLPQSCMQLSVRHHGYALLTQQLAWQQEEEAMREECRE